MGDMPLNGIGTPLRPRDTRVGDDVVPDGTGPLRGGGGGECARARVVADTARGWP